MLAFPEHFHEAVLIFPEQLDHLPATKRRELSHVVQIIFEEFEECQNADSALKPAAIPIIDRPPFRFEAGHHSNQ